MGREISAVLLAGGQARRMGGGDKCLRLLGGRTILERVIERVCPQVASLVLNANGDPKRFGKFGLPVAGDIVDGFAGPLSGILTGLRWTLKNADNCEWMVSIPTDAPFIPKDLVASLMAEITQKKADIACAVSGGRTHPVVGLWPVRLADALERALIDENMRKIDHWTARYCVIEVDFPIENVDPFFNANRPEDVLEAERLLSLEC
ncbi:MAG: Molybdenum cofactor guanylyltransferase [Alphaproteobacteria bacterium MarineAlpha4_Bin2]|nr:MAG: Molybdenum cofactor guanylyltransferase [Alphaproteobacteria bacterium MarineAlpha4_Bin2]